MSTQMLESPLRSQEKEKRMERKNIEQEDLPCANPQQAVIGDRSTSIQSEQLLCEDMNKIEITKKEVAYPFYFSFLTKKEELMEEVLSSLLGTKDYEEVYKGEFWGRLEEALQRANKDQLDKLQRASWNINLGLCIWTRPRKGFYRVDTDGSVNGVFRKKDGYYKDKKGGYGAIIRDNSSMPIAAVAGVSKPVSLLYHQLEGVKRGLELAINNECRKVRLCTNQAFIVKFIQKQYEPSDEDRESVEPIRDAIRKLIPKFEVFYMEDVEKEANRAADYLSKLFIKERVMKPHEFDEELNRIIAEDTNCKMVFEN
ncbi:Ribonuclease H domain [Macleaya cordata]|uniref:Ribonuclease H domain n=1 Tax=Macleaya cordata TaxID=56857 RepID=A0A200R6E2_MACCD|nr:Ribonuclease H domain [Macleaya cordata]